jgi:HAD superfamily hydrolase (TIGR01549 family)
VVLQAVILDLDDTLIVEEATARASLRSTARLLPDLEPARVEEVVLGAARSVWRAGPYHGLAVELGIASYRTKAWRAALAQLGSDDPGLAEAMADAYETAQRAGHPLIDGAREAVEGLSARFRLGLLTNGPSDIQRLKLEGTGLASAFEAVVVSGEAGVGKPSPDAFRLVLEGLDIDPGEAVMVGDSWERDVEGAQAVGIHPVWISGGRSAPGADPTVTLVESVGEIIEALAEPAG